MITVHFYAGLRELAKVPRLELPWSEDMTVASLCSHLCSNYPALASLLMRSRFAVNDQLVNNVDMIPDHAEVAILPPVSGG